MIGPFSASAVFILWMMTRHKKYWNRDKNTPFRAHMFDHPTAGEAIRLFDSSGRVWEYCAKCGGNCGQCGTNIGKDNPKENIPWFEPSKSNIEFLVKKLHKKRP